MSDRELARTLERIGEAFDLGEYEIEAYLAVLEHGELTASDIADDTDIPQPRVYDTVRSLSDRGLVEIRESRPMKAVAIDPEEAFDNLQASLDDLVGDLETVYTAPARETEAVSLVKSRSTILRYFEDVIQTAEFDLSLSLTPALVSRFEGVLADAVDRGVNVELVVTPASEAPDPRNFDYHRIATEARARRGITTPVVAVADGNYSIYATQDAIRETTDRYGVIFNRSALGFLVSGFFGTVIWTTADTPLVEDTGDRSLPRRYSSIRRCVKDLRRITNGETLYATVEGRDVVTGESRVVTGEIVDVEFMESEEVASFVVETEDGPVPIGGRVAAYEDVEAHEITLGKEPEPGTY
ncbi:HTH-type sugar sensing transcriptional regulator TrmB [Halospeciosus flavus]|uniref:HTH-type sugar sensing transcriptional regulator TrmB n=1 Tax=Halospeciosus flavus TaxID=3032283 RepID=A0ABD5Z1L4_9EURY|nr:TrmB family transcriptional regulator [Halospeciosus flavus]